MLTSTLLEESRNDIQQIDLVTAIDFSTRPLTFWQPLICKLSGLPSQSISGKTY